MNKLLCATWRKTRFKNEKPDLNGAINIGTFALADLLSQSHQALKQGTANTSLSALAIGR